MQFIVLENQPVPNHFAIFLAKSLSLVQLGEQTKGVKVCLEDAGCRASLRSAIASSLTPEVTLANFGSLLALFSETVLQGAFSPSTLSKENKMIIDYHNEMEMEVIEWLEELTVKAFGKPASDKTMNHITAFNSCRICVRVSYKVSERLL